MKVKVKKAVERAKKFLTEGQRDVAHDLKHHRAVWRNCLLIVKSERLEVDKDVLKIAAFWHDIIFKIPNKRSIDDVVEVCRYLRKYLSTLNFPKNKVDKVIKAIRYHEFGDKPVTTEGKILQDADKMDVVSFERGIRAYNAYKVGKMSYEEIVDRGNTFLNWIPRLINTFHYQISKKVTAEKLEKYLKDEMTFRIFMEIDLEDKFNETLKKLEISNNYTGK